MANATEEELAYPALTQIPKLELKRSGHLESWSTYMN
jgi:hypothetical protein